MPTVQDITFYPGDVGPQTIEIPTIDDTIVEAVEQFQLSLVSSLVPAVKLGKPATVRIKDNDGKSTLTL